MTEPMIVPTTPMTSPANMNIFMMLPPDAPMDFRVAFSLLFSMTIMVSVPMMLNDATMMMTTRISDMPIFSSFSAEKKFLFISIQFRVKYGNPTSDWMEA